MAVSRVFWSMKVASFMQGWPWQMRVRVEEELTSDLETFEFTKPKPLILTRVVPSTEIRAGSARRMKGSK